MKFRIFTDSFYETIKNKYFSGNVDNSEIEILLKYFNKYNLDTFTSESIMSETALIEFYKKFLINYDDALDVNDIIKRMEINDISHHNIFEMINNIYDVLNIENKIKYNFDEDDKTMTVLDINSIYENSSTVSVAINNLIYDYYQYIYNIYKEDEESDNFTFSYYYKNSDVYYNFKRGVTLRVLQNSNFYNIIYNTLLSLYNDNNNNNNPLILKFIEIVDETFF